MNVKELQTFENPTIGTIRGFVDKDGETWFLAAQVCRCLGIKDTSTAIKQLKQRMQVVEDYFRNRATVSNCTPNRDVASNYSPKAKNITLQDGKNHTQVTIIPEAWLYELIFASRKQSAIVFRAWVTHEVLPSLRKHGEYRMQGKLIRHSLTDSIKNSGENERMHGHAYSNYTKMIYKALGLPSKVNRDSVPAEILEKIARMEDMVSSMVANEKQYWEIKNFIFGTGRINDR